MARADRGKTDWLHLSAGSVVEWRTGVWPELRLKGSENAVKGVSRLPKAQQLIVSVRGFQTREPHYLEKPAIYAVLNFADASGLRGERRGEEGGGSQGVITREWEPAGCTSLSGGELDTT
jgi:hypothetical protein